MISRQQEAARRQEERLASRDGTREWLENARAQRKTEDTTGGSSWSMLEEFARMGVMPSNGRRVSQNGNGGGKE